MCSKIWFQENGCDCQWESNFSRKTSHRNRKRERNFKPREDIEKTSTEYRNPKVYNDSTDDMEEDVFWVGLTFY